MLGDAFFCFKINEILKADSFTVISWEQLGESWPKIGSKLSLIGIIKCSGKTGGLGESSMTGNPQLLHQQWCVEAATDRPCSLIALFFFFWTLDYDRSRLLPGFALCVWARGNFGPLVSGEGGGGDWGRKELSTRRPNDDKSENRDSKCSSLWLRRCPVASLCGAEGSGSAWEECDLVDKKITSNDE